MKNVKRLSEHCVVEYYLNDEGNLHREDGPARLYWHYTKEDIENCSNGILNKEEYYLNGKLFRNEGPVVIKYANRHISYQEFLSTKDGLKNVIFKYQKNQLRYKKEIFENGTSIITHFLFGKLNSKTYFKGNVVHRVGGPAIVYYDTNGQIKKQEYYLNGNKILDELQIMVLEATKDEC